MKKSRIGKLLLSIGVFAAISSASTISFVRPGGCASFASGSCVEYVVNGFGVASSPALFPSFEVAVSGVVSSPFAVLTLDSVKSFSWTGGLTSSGVNFTFAGASDADPIVSWGFTAVNSSATASKAVSFTAFQPVIGGPFTSARATYNGSLSADPTFPPGASSVVNDSFLDGALYISIPTGCVADPSDSQRMQCAGGSKSMSLGALPVSTMSTMISFILSPKTQASFNGNFSITAVPEPGTVVLIGVGLLVLSGLGRRVSSKR
jgi:hypothetical protein